MKPKPSFQPFNKEVFLFLLPLFFVVHGFNRNRDIVGAADALNLLVQYLFITLIAVSVFYFIFKSWRKASVYTLVLSCFYFFFGAIHDTIKTIVGNHWLSSYSFILPVLFSACVVLFLFYFKSKKKFDRLVRFANILFIVFLIIELITISQYKKPAQQSFPNELTGNHCDTCDKPDIYLIVADEYAGEQELRELLNFDNNSFYAALATRGFRIIKDSKSNYNSTPYSIASLFMMDYLHGNQGRAANSEDLNKCYNNINANPFLYNMKQMDYSIINHSIFKLDEQKPLVNSMFLSVGKAVIDVHTLWGRFNRDLRFNLLSRFKIKGEDIRFAKEEIRKNELLLQETEKLPGTKANKPRFIYTHLMMPHFPYLKDKEGNLANMEDLSNGNWNNSTAYLDYLVYSNKRLLQLIDKIIRSSIKPPVIILMSDHGYRQFQYSAKEVPYLFMNINAIYLPHRNYHHFYDGMSNVNQLSMLLNTLFKHNKKPLKDSTILLP